MAHKLPLKDIQFLSEFHAFALSKGDEGYDATEDHICALAQFGYPGVEVWDLGDVPAAAYQAAVFGKRADCTFDQLATRLEALLADAPQVVLS